MGAVNQGLDKRARAIEFRRAALQAIAREWRHTTSPEPPDVDPAELCARTPLTLYRDQWRAGYAAALRAAAESLEQKLQAGKV